MSEQCPYCKTYVDSDATVCPSCGAEVYYEDGTGWKFFFAVVAGSFLFALVVDTWWALLIFCFLSFVAFTAAGKQKNWSR